MPATIMGRLIGAAQVVTALPGGASRVLIYVQGTGLKAGPVPCIARYELARLVGELVGVRLAEVGRLALEAGHVSLLDLHHGLGTARRNFAIRAEDRDLVLQRIHVQSLVAGVVLG